MTQRSMRPVNKRVNRRGTATRQALLDAAIELWAATGWRGTGIIPVAKRAGVTDATLLHHFRSKENFLIEVLAELDRRALAEAEGWHHTGLDVIRHLPDIVRRGFQAPGLWKLHHMLQAENLDPGDPAYEYYALRQRYLHDLFADAVRTGQARGEIRPDVQPDLVAAEILAFIMGMRLHIEHGPDKVDAAAVFDDFAQRMVDTLRIGS